MPVRLILNFEFAWNGVAIILLFLRNGLWVSSSWFLWGSYRRLGILCFVG